MIKLPKRIELFHVASGITAEAAIALLSDELIEQRMGEAWWNDPVIYPELASREIDRHWDWKEVEIEHEGDVLPSQKLAALTGDGLVQGAMLCSVVPVACELDPGHPAVFVELLFAAPTNRHWIRRDGAEQFRGVGLQLLRTAAELSLDLGFGGRLKLDASPGFVEWYRKRGLRAIAGNPILHEGVLYTPMELTADAVSELTATPAVRAKKGARGGKKKR